MQQHQQQTKNKSVSQLPVSEQVDKLMFLVAVFVLFVCFSFYLRRKTRKETHRGRRVLRFMIFVYYSLN